MQEPSTTLVRSLTPDNLTTEQGGFVIPPSSPLSGVDDDSLGPAEPAKPPSPALPSPVARGTDTATEVPDNESCPAISRLSSPAHEDILNQPTPEPETGHPLTIASPSPRISSPTALGSKDGTSDHHPMGVQIAASETGTVIPPSEPQDSVKAETLLTSPEKPEAVISPATATPPPSAEVVPLPVREVSPGTSHASTLMEINIGSEAAFEPAVTMDKKQSWVDEQRDAEMDVDEELLNLIGEGDKLPSRSSHTSSEKQKLSPLEDRFTSSHPSVKQESAPGILVPFHPPATATTFPTSQEGISMLSRDTALSARDSETSTLKSDERSAPKKKVNYLTLVLGSLF
jgi:hypothetical protein